MNVIWFCRSKAYNTCQLLHFVCEIYEQFFRNRLFNIVLGRKKKLACTKPLLPEQYITATDQPLQFRVRSEADPAQEYDVDLQRRICSCASGESGFTCKHQQAVLIPNNLKCDQLYCGSAQQKHLYAVIADGDKAANESFFADDFISSPPSEQQCSVATNMANTAVVCDDSHFCEQQHYDLEDHTCTNLGLLQHIHVLLHEDATKSIKSKEMEDALSSFTKTLASNKSTGTFISALHKFGKNVVSFKNSGRCIPCQSKALSRRRQNATKGAAPLEKGRPQLAISKQRRRKRKRNLAISIQGN